MQIIKDVDKLELKGYWAENITRVRSGNKEFIYACIRRKHSYSDVEMDGEGKYIGVEEEPVYVMTVDTDTASSTSGQRIPMLDIDGKPIIENHMIKFNLEATEENLDKLNVLCDTTVHGETQLYWEYGGKTFSCHNPDEFWETDVREIRKIEHELKSVGRRRREAAGPAEAEAAAKPPRARARRSTGGASK